LKSSNVGPNKSSIFAKAIFDVSVSRPSELESPNNNLASAAKTDRKGVAKNKKPIWRGAAAVSRKKNFSMAAKIINYTALGC
jgi:hypothetical protein